MRLEVRFAPGVLLMLLCGCEAPMPQAREQAQARWNEARAQIKARLAADQFEAGDIAGAAAELAEAQRLTPDRPDLLALRVRVLLAEGRIDEADELLRGVREREGDGAARTPLDGPRQAELEYLTGVVRQQQQRWEEALAAFARALALNEREVAYVVALTQVRLQLGEAERALELLARLEPRFGWTSAYHAALAECHEQVRNWPAAAAAWQRAASDPAADEEIRRRWAAALVRAGQFAEAAPVLEELVGGGGEAGTAAAGGGGDSLTERLMLAECAIETGRPAEARVQLQAVLRAVPGHRRALQLLARVLAREGDFAGALAIARRALGSEAPDATTLEMVAALAQRAGEADLAVSTARKLLAVSPANPVALAVLADNPARR